MGWIKWPPADGVKGCLAEWPCMGRCHYECLVALLLYARAQMVDRFIGWPWRHHGMISTLRILLSANVTATRTPGQMQHQNNGTSATMP